MSSPSANITSVLKETRLFPPPEGFAKQANAGFPVSQARMMPFKRPVADALNPMQALDAGP